MNIASHPRRPSPSPLRNFRVRRLSQPGHGVGVYPDPVGALSFSSSHAVGCKLSALDFPFNLKFSTLKRLPVTPFPATLTSLSQIAENTPTLSPIFAALSSRVNHNPFVCYSYRKHPGWRIWSFSVTSALKSTRCSSLVDPPNTMRRPPASPLESASIHRPATIASKELTPRLNPLDATFTKNWGEGPQPPTPQPVESPFRGRQRFGFRLPILLRRKLSAVSCRLLASPRDTGHRTRNTNSK